MQIHFEVKFISIIKFGGIIMSLTRVTTKEGEVYFKDSKTGNMTSSPFKNYSIFKKPAGSILAIPQGWSWPAFLFPAVWCLVVGLPGIGVTLMIATIIVNTTITNAEAFFLANFIALGVHIWIGTKGNEFRFNKLKNNLLYLGNVNAISKDTALALGMKINTTDPAYLIAEYPISDSEKENDATDFYCDKCNTKLSKDAKTCPNCGECFDTVVYYCDKCDTPISDDAKFCPNCGEKL
jgi:RNA polymerase subunit RPABC4/transcription elongation factor Spt4